MIWVYAIRNLWRKKARTVATILVIALLVGMISGFLIAAKSAELSAQHFVAEALGDSDVYIRNSTGGLLKVDAILPKIKSIGGVEKVDYVLVLYGYVLGTKKRSATFIGLTNGFYGKAILGADLEVLNKNDCIVMSPLAELLNISKGDSISSIVFFNNTAIRAEFHVGAIKNWTQRFKWEQPPLNIYLNIDYLANITGLQGYASMIYVKVSEGYSIKDVADRLSERISSVSVETVSISWLQEFTFTYMVLLAYPTISAIIVLLAVIYMNIDERRKELGVLKVFGASGISLILTLILEIVVISILGLIIGTGFSWFVAYIFLSLYKTTFMLKDIYFYWSFDALKIGWLIGFLVPLFVALIMANALRKLKPVEVLSEEIPIEVAKLDKSWIIMGIIFLILGVLSIFQNMGNFTWALYVGIVILLSIGIIYKLQNPLSKALSAISGLPGMLATVFSKRRINAIIAIAMLLTISLSFIAITNSISNAYNNSARYVANQMNFNMVASFSSPISWGEAENISKISYIRKYLPIGYLGAISINKTILRIAVTNMTKLKEFLKTPILNGSFESVKNDSFAIFTTAISNNKYLKNTLGKKPYGKTIMIPTPKGNISVVCKLVLDSALPLTWFYVGPVSIGLALFVDISFAKKYFEDTYKFSVFGAFIDSEKSAENLGRDLEQLYGKYSVNVFSVEDWVQEGIQISLAVSGFFYLIGYTIVLIAALLLFVIQFRNVELWRRELGTLKAFGLSEVKLMLIFVIQVILIVLIATISYAIAYPWDIGNMSSSYESLKVPLVPDWFALMMVSLFLVLILLVASMLAVYRFIKKPVIALISER